MGDLANLRLEVAMPEWWSFGILPPFGLAESRAMRVISSWTSNAAAISAFRLQQ